MLPNACGFQRLNRADSNCFSHTNLSMDVPSNGRRAACIAGGGLTKISQLCMSVLGHKSNEGTTILHCLLSTSQSSPADNRTLLLLEKAKPAKVTRQTHRTGSLEGGASFTVAQGRNWGQLWPSRWPGQAFPALPYLTKDSEETIWKAVLISV